MAYVMVKSALGLILEAYNLAKKIQPHKMITLEYIPTKRETITFL